MNERQRIEELNDHARRVFRAETAYAKADAFAASEQARYQAACEAVHAAEAERCKAWAVYQAQFVRFVQDCVHEDPARSASLAEVLSWFTPKERETDPDGRPIFRSAPLVGQHEPGDDRDRHDRPEAEARRQPATD